MKGVIGSFPGRHDLPADRPRGPGDHQQAADAVAKLEAERAKILAAKPLAHPPALESGTFAEDAQEAFCKHVSASMGFDFETGRLDRSVHPFTGGAGPQDAKANYLACLTLDMSALFTRTCCAVCVGALPWASCWCRRKGVGYAGLCGLAGRQSRKPFLGGNSSRTPTRTLRGRR